MTSVDRADPPPFDFFVIGAMKAATTGLCDWLGAQPGVAVADPKEPSIYTSDAALSAWSGRIDTLFAAAEPGDLRGDGSTDYAKYPEWPGVPARVRAAAPEARIVYSMRHPVRRALSQYRFDWLRGGTTMSLEDALDHSPGLLDFGRYALQLEQWLEHFPSEQILLVFMEAFTSDPEREVRRVLHHLGAEGAARSQTLVPPATERSNETDTLVRQSRPLKLLRESRFGKAVVKPLLPARLIEGYKVRMLERSRPDVTGAALSRMMGTFDEDLARLGQMIAVQGLSCDTWDDLASRTTPRLRPPTPADGEHQMEDAPPWT